MPACIGKLNAQSVASFFIRDDGESVGCGFRRIPPFGSYREDPLSLFFEREAA